MSQMHSDDYPKGYFEDAQGSNYRNYADDPGWRGVLNVVVDWYAPGARFIEMASAKGYFIYHARERGYDAVGFDISEYAVSKSFIKARKYNIVHNAADPWPYESESADAVFGFEFFEHVPEDEVQKVLAEAWLVLKPGGRLILKTGIIIPDDHPFVGQEDHDHTHVTIKDRAWWEDQITDAGFEQTDDERSIENSLDDEFAKRDWFGRWFVWRTPTHDCRVEEDTDGE